MSIKGVHFEPLSLEQEMEICSLIVEWYIHWKNKLVDYDSRTHRLGFAKEELKNLIIEKMGQDNYGE